MTAGTGVDTNTTNLANGKAGLTDVNKLIDASSSICPKGWKLPASGAYENSVSGAGNIAWPYERESSFYDLFAAYGHPTTGSSVTDTSLVRTKWIANNGNPYTHISEIGKIRLDYSPMYFVRSGGVLPTAGSLRYGSIDGNYWSNTAYPNHATYTYSLTFNNSHVFPADRNLRYYGYSARCVAK